jgi:hypothetical protein
MVGQYQAVCFATLLGYSTIDASDRLLLEMEEIARQALSVSWVLPNHPIAVSLRVAASQTERYFFQSVPHCYKGRTQVHFVASYLVVETAISSWKESMHVVVK